MLVSAMGVGVEMHPTRSEAPPPPESAGKKMSNGSGGGKKDGSAASASTQSPADPATHSPQLSGKTMPNGIKDESNLDTSKDESITVDVESMGDVSDDKLAPSVPEGEQRTPLNNVTNHTNGTGLTVKKEEPKDWSEYFLGDMPLSQYLQAVKKYVLTPLIRHPRSIAFRKPVDPVALGIYPIYNQIITRPMDLGTVKTKVEKNLYNNKAVLLNDIDLVWNNAIRFNPLGHEVHDAALFLQKHTIDHCLKAMKVNQGALSTPLSAKKPVSYPTPIRGVREARKKAPLGLPGEYDDLKPQHLEQKYASKLTEPLKACDNILRNLMLQSQHWEYVEPFMKTKPGRMSLNVVYERMRKYHYTNTREFAADIRRIITETYRDADDPEEDFRSIKASKLQKEFERQFALVNTDNEGHLEQMSRTSAMADPFIRRLVSAQALITSMHCNVSTLVEDYDVIKAGIKAKKAAQREEMVQSQKSRKRKTSDTSPRKPAAKRPKPTPSTPQSAVNTFSQKPSSEQIGEWINMLDDSKQENLLEILRSNGEPIEVDADGSVELSLENWGQKTLDEVELFLRREIPAERPKNNDSSSSDSSSSDDSSSTDSSDDD